MGQQTIVFGMNTMFAVRQFLPEILEMATKSGFRVVVIAPGGRGQRRAAPELPPGIEFRPVRMKREISLFSDVCALFRIWWILRSIRPDITNMSTPKMGLVGGLAAWMARVPHRIYTLRGLRYETTGSWKRRLLMACERLACASANRVICISRSVRDTVVRQHIVSSAKGTLLGDRVSEGISLQKSVTPAVVRVNLKAGIPVIGFVGRLTKDKGIYELVEAFRLLRGAGVQSQLLLVGDFEPGDPVDPATADFIRTDPDVYWPGFVADASAYYPLMDVFVFPTHREGLGRVLLEAAAASKPVVSTRTTGVVDVVVEGVTGLLVPPGDAPALAQATRTLIEDPQLAAVMGRRARKRVDEQFDNTIYLNRLGALLRSFVEPVAQVSGLRSPKPAAGRR